MNSIANKPNDIRSAIEARNFSAEDIDSICRMPNYLLRKIYVDTEQRDIDMISYAKLPNDILRKIYVDAIDARNRVVFKDIAFTLYKAYDYLLDEKEVDYNMPMFEGSRDVMRVKIWYNSNHYYMTMAIFYDKIHERDNLYLPDADEVFKIEQEGYDVTISEFMTPSDTTYSPSIDDAEYQFFKNHYAIQAYIERFVEDAYGYYVYSKSDNDSDNNNRKYEYIADHLFDLRF